MNPRLRVLTGRPTAAEAAAVLLALTADEPAEQTIGTPPAGTGWRQAARLESMGVGQATSPSQVRDAARDVN